MKTTSVLLIIIIGVILTSCATSKYVQTGKEEDPFKYSTTKYLIPWNTVR